MINFKIDGRLQFATTKITSLYINEPMTKTSEKSELSEISNEQVSSKDSTNLHTKEEKIPLGTKQQKSKFFSLLQITFMVLITGILHQHLWLVCKLQLTPLVRILVAVGCDINVKSYIDFGYRPMHYAATVGNLEMISILFHSPWYEVELEAYDDHHLTSFHRAVQFDHIKVAEYLLTKGSVVDTEGIDTLSALHRASYLGHSEMVKMLLKRGANINQQSLKFGMSSLHYALEMNQSAVASILVATGSDLKVKDTLGQTPLHTAVNSGAEDMVALLLSNGANINEGDDGGATPIFMAYMKKNIKLAEFLAQVFLHLSFLSTLVLSVQALFISLCLSFSLGPSFPLSS